MDTLAFLIPKIVGIIWYFYISADKKTYTTVLFMAHAFLLLVVTLSFKLKKMSNYVDSIFDPKIISFFIDEFLRKIWGNSKNHVFFRSDKPFPQFGSSDLLSLSSEKTENGWINMTFFLQTADFFQFFS